MRHYLARQTRDFPYKLISKFKNLGPENAISLFCDPRGGSTWLAETLNSIPQSMIIDEPLHLNSVKKLKNIDFSWRQYIPENEPWNEAKVIFQTILKGKILSAGICNRNVLSEVIKANQIIAKIIRGKALLPWYVKQFDFKYKPLMVVRHPFAVAASLLNHSAWSYEFQSFEIPDGPFNEFYKQHEVFLTSLQTKEEQLTALWCMTNNTVLNHSENNHSWITINYENLVLEPKKYFQMIFDQWDLEIPERLLDRISVASSSTEGRKSINPERLLSDWTNKLKTEQINRLQKVLDYFEVSYYGKDIMPLIPANKVHLIKASP
jgi:hypothetical protein